MSPETGVPALSSAVILVILALWPLLLTAAGAWLAIRRTVQVARGAAFDATLEVREGVEQDRLSTAALRDEIHGLFERTQTARRAAAASESNAKRRERAAASSPTVPAMSLDDYAVYVEAGGTPIQELEDRFFGGAEPAQ